MLLSHQWKLFKAVDATDIGQIQNGILEGWHLKSIMYNYEDASNSYDSLYTTYQDLSSI